MSLEQKVNTVLKSCPMLKKIIKRCYQFVMCKIGNNILYEGNIERLSPEGKDEYFFGYYDKSPWDVSGRYVLCLKTHNTWKAPAPKDEAEILLIDTERKNVKTIAHTHAWNVQQGCMLQWLGPDFGTKIIYNDFYNDHFCSKVLDVFTGEQRELVAPVYTVSSDGLFALTLDFTRLHRLRPGYGYSNLKDDTINEQVPDSSCIWKLDIEHNTLSSVLCYKDFYNFEHKTLMENAVHKINHIMISPDNTRFMVLHRWIKGKKKYTRLVTANLDGSEMFNLSDEKMVSHCYWKDNKTILAFEHKDVGGNGYYLMTDKTNEYTHLWTFLDADGHPSYSPDGTLVVTDTYPNAKRIQTLRVLSDDASYIIAKVFAPFKYDNDTRCDLHPRWSRDGKKICFDSCFEGHRGLYCVNVSKINFAKKDNVGIKLYNQDASNRKKIVFVMTSCRKTGPTQQTLNIIKNLDKNIFEPILVTLYEEESTSRLADYLPFISKHFFVKTSKKNIILGKIKSLEQTLSEIKPDIVHSVGVFPDYVISRIKKYHHVFTLRNYVYDDYPALYGKLKGEILAKLQLYALRHSDKVITCSQSLSKIYKDKLNLNLDFIRNGVDTDKFTPATNEEKLNVRKKLNLPLESYIFVCSGQIIERKNLSFLLESFCKQFDNDNSIWLVILGDGAEREKLENRYSAKNNIKFFGAVSDVSYYLKACDCCVSSSKSEGLPNSVLEAMAIGLPVILSDIEQHKEIFLPNSNIGFLYAQNNISELCDCLYKMKNMNNEDMKKSALKSVRENFDSKIMSMRYQEIVYKELLKI